MSIDAVARLGWIAACLVLGLLLTWQAPVNAEAARRLGSPAFAAMLSIGLSFLLVTVFVAVTVGFRPDVAAMRAGPWWAWLGGITGAVFVMGALLIVPHTGTFVYVMSVIAGQMIGAVTADRFGLFGLPVVELDSAKIVGILLVLSGVLTFHLSE
ncbi:DMT family transporter [Alsobacter sp. R-9]